MMKWFLKKSIIELVPVNLGAAKIAVPVFDTSGDCGGKTLFVTAGMDGDEYAPIDAAYRLIQELHTKIFCGRVVIIPIVNMSGFDKEVSFSPLDGTYPRHAGVGKKDGTPTERLIYWIVHTFAVHADMWLDLHGGSLTETIDPFLWGWETRVQPIDIFVRSFCRSYAPSFAVFEHYAAYGKAAALAEKGCSYVVAEAGGSCQRKDSDIKQHCAWVLSAMESLGMIASSGEKNKSVRLYKKYRQYASDIQGIWHPSFTDIRKIRKGDALGFVQSFDLAREQKIVAREDAQILWIKEGMKSSDREILVATAYV